MELFIGKQLQVVGYSFILGLIFGGLYDIIRIIHIICGIASYAGNRENSGTETGMKRGKIPFLLFFLCDAAYMLTVTAVFSVFQYWQMNGTFRLFVLLSVTAGIAVWHVTAGRVVTACSEAIVRLLRLAARWLLIRPVRMLCGILRKILLFVYRQTAGRMVRLIRQGIRSVRSDRIRRKFRNDIRFSDGKNRTEKSVENKRKPI